MNITIIGYYGSNFGDLLMLKGLVENIGAATIKILSYGCGSHLLEQSFIKDRSIEVLELNSACKKLILRTIKKSNAIVWGGGTCFMDEGGTGGIKYMLLAKLLGARVYYAGIGADNHNRLATRLYMLLATLVSSAMYVRDYDSIRAFITINPFAVKKIIKTHDLAYASGMDTLSKNSENEKYLLFCPRNLEQYKSLSSNTNRKLLEITKKIALELGLEKVIVLNADCELDQSVSEDSVKYFRSVGLTSEVVSGYNLDKSVAILRDCEFLLTVRLHPAVIALENSIPFAVFNYSEKNRKFAEENCILERLIQKNDISNYRPIYTLAKKDNKECRRIEVIQVIKGLVPGAA